MTESDINDSSARPGGIRAPGALIPDPPSDLSVFNSRSARGRGARSAAPRDHLAILTVTKGDRPWRSPAPSPEQCLRARRGAAARRVAGRKPAGSGRREVYPGWDTRWDTRVVVVFRYHHPVLPGHAQRTASWPSARWATRAGPGYNGTERRSDRQWRSDGGSVPGSTLDRPDPRWHTPASHRDHWSRCLVARCRDHQDCAH